MATQQAPKRPRLSLQIKTTVSSAVRSSRALAAVDPTDPTAFNTLSNVYVTTIERSTPLNAEPLTAINTLASFSLVTPIDYQDTLNHVVTPFVANYPETPVTAHATSPRPLDFQFPSTMTATPPLSGTVGPSESKVFTFSPMDTGFRTSSESLTSPIEARYQKRRLPQVHLISNRALPPYTHPCSLHSILRNSPLPPRSPRTAIPPPSPRRQSLRLQERAAKRVGYNSPIEQEIITNKYTRSHIDLLVEDASPVSPNIVPIETSITLDTSSVFTSNEIQDGGRTPGPFEEMRRRVTGRGNNPPLSPSGIRKRKKKEKKRRWVWTIGQEDEDDEEEGGAVAALRAEAARANAKAANDNNGLPALSIPQIVCMETEELTPSVESSDAWSEMRDVEMSDASSVVSEDAYSLHPNDVEMDLRTPVGPKRLITPEKKRDTPVPPELLISTSKRDTPIPPELLPSNRSTPGPSEGL